MGNKLSKIGINNLEKFLNDVFIKECVFKATKEELDFIQTGIEALVHDIVDLFFDAYIKYELYEDYYKVRKRKKSYRNEDRNCHEEIVNRFQKSLEKVYFLLKKEKQYIKVKCGSSKIIPVGSFYENTKNNFPNEFDFIFVLFSVKLPENGFDRVECKHHLPLGKSTIASLIEDVTLKYKHRLKYKSVTGTLNDNMELSFVTYVKDHGPASMLQFIYKNGDGTERFIHVDLVGAAECIVDDNSRSWTEDMFDKYIKPDTFCAYAKLTDAFLVIDNYFSLTETEIAFMKNVLSKKHLRVYRILKFLINGRDDYDVFSRLSDDIDKDYHRDIGEGITTYTIKTAIIHHHDKCTNMDNDDIGPCVLQVLQHLLNYFSEKRLYGSPYSLHSFQPDSSELTVYLSGCKTPRPLDEINKLMTKLRSLQNTKDVYNFDQFKIESVTKQFTDHTREQMIDTEKRKEWPCRPPLHSKRNYDRVCLDNTLADKRSTHHSYHGCPEISYISKVTRKQYFRFTNFDSHLRYCKTLLNFD